MGGLLFLHPFQALRYPLDSFAVPLVTVTLVSRSEMFVVFVFGGWHFASSECGLVRDCPAFKKRMR